MSDLRNKLIRLAHTKPELREQLLPILKKEASGVRSSLGDVMSSWFTQFGREMVKYGNDNPNPLLKANITIKKVMPTGIIFQTPSKKGRMDLTVGVGLEVKIDGKTVQVFSLKFDKGGEIISTIVSRYL